MSDNQETIVWSAYWVGGGSSGVGLRTQRHHAVVTAKRVKVLGAGSFGSDQHFHPDEVNWTEADAVRKLTAVVERDEEHARWLIEQCHTKRVLIKRKLHELETP